MNPSAAGARGLKARLYMAPEPSNDFPGAATRRIRVLAGRPIRWWTRARLLLLRHEELTGLVFWAALTGFCGALASVAFREGIRLFEWLLTGQTSGLVHAASELQGLQRVVTPMIGGVAAGLVLHYGTRLLDSRRSVDYMEAVVVRDGTIAARPTLIRSLSSLFTIGSGGSIGREGPMVQLAALLGSKLAFASRAPVPRRRLLVACGAAAGISAAYNAPIAGALFVAEIVMGSIAMESFGPLLVSSVTANVTIHRFLGYGPVFEVPHVQFGANWELVFYGVLGVLIGHLAPPFLGLLEWTRHRFASLPAPLYVRLGAGGLIVGIISLGFPQVWGNGYSVVGAILAGQLAGWLLLAVLAAKVASTAATVGSGAVGGIFTPTLFIGAAVGALVCALLHLAVPGASSTPGAYALVGMGGFLAATTHAPLTSILMIFEMTLDYDVVLPLMLACVTAYFTAKAYRRGRSVYHESLQPEREANEPDWRPQTVQALVKPAAAVVTQDMTVRQMLDGLPKRPVQTVYVVDEDRQLLAAAVPREILARVSNGEIDPDGSVGSVAVPIPFVLTPDMTLGAALDGFVRQRATVLPVTAGHWRTTLLGEVSRHDLLLALQDHIAGTGQ
jgi:CIC family chloride channel protein